MSPFVHLVMFGWIPVVIGLFSRLRPRHAVITSFLVAWLFLPNVSYPLPGLPDYDKMSATCWGIFIAAAIFDMENFKRLRLRAIDIPMIIWCLCPVISSLNNGYGLYDGIAVSFRQTVTWGFPYIIGRIYFNDLQGLKEFAIGMIIGGMIYVPLCLWESRMSPQLHYNLYGFYQHSFAQTYRWGGWRPMVFMSHGLMVGVWMMSAALLAVWFSMTGAVKRLGGMPMSAAAAVLLFTALWCRSTAAIGLLLMGIAVLFLSKRFGKPIFVICLIAIPLFYLPARATGIWTGEGLVSFVAEHISPDRADSLEFRMHNENILAEKALQRPVFGWATWGKSRVYDDQGQDISVTDGLWIITFGNHGLVGLISLTLAVLMPVFLLLRYYPARHWTHPQLAPAVVLCVLLGLYMVDNLLNAMINPIFMVASGGITGLLPKVFEEEATVEMDEDYSEPFVGYSPRFL